MSRGEAHVPHPKLTARFDEALLFAASKHRAQIRKGTPGVPYLSHLLSVAALVLEAGGDEDLAIAALLHDTAEDQGGRAALAEIRRHFGERVCRIVDGCTDTYENPKPDWCTRKRNYIAHLRCEADLDTCMVSAADKVHNARSILSDLYLSGDTVFDRFKASKDETLWYYRELLDAFGEASRRHGTAAGDGEYGLQRLVHELKRVVGELEESADRPGESTCRE